MAEFIRGQLALVAQLERALIRDRVSAGKLQKKKLGRHIHGRVPYGYRSTGGILEPVEDLIPVVRRIYRDARDGWDARPDRPSLNRDGIPSAQGGEWKPQVVRSILTNPAYVGERYGVRNAHTAIVSRRRFNEAQAALATRARAARPTPANRVRLSESPETGVGASFKASG